MIVLHFSMQKEDVMCFTFILNLLTIVYPRGAHLKLRLGIHVSAF